MGLPQVHTPDAPEDLEHRFFNWCSAYRTSAAASKAAMAPFMAGEYHKLAEIFAARWHLAIGEEAVTGPRIRLLWEVCKFQVTPSYSPQDPHQAKQQFNSKL
jgi:hypothetical protein